MNQSTKWISGIIAVVAVVAVGYVVFSGQRKPIATEPIKIAAILPLTGDLAEYGEDELASFRLFIDDWNKKNDKKIELFIEDSKSDPKQAISAFNKLLAFTKPKFILTLGSSISLAIQPLANEKQIPVVTVAANPQVAQGYMIQNLPTTDDYVSLNVKDMLNRKLTKVGFIFRNDDLGKGARESFIKKLNGKITIIEEPVLVDETDFRTAITKIKSEKPEAIFVIHTGKKLGLLISQIRTIMGNVPIYSTLEVNYPEVKETAGSAFYNIKYTDLNVDYTTPTLKIFKNKYTTANNKEPSVDSILGYNSMILVSNCLNTKENPLQCLFETKIEGLTGLLSMSNNKVNYLDSMIIKEVE
jgi:branched-chain amino acid transport system substrate-binding protein